ncbi:MAG: DUF2809 domain-containing protein [Akkermansiaceae bacterium]|nr:DUF2809 domain-containing protein [Akkermansiaceae bacterium]
MPAKTASRLVYVILLGSTIIIGLLTRSAFIPADTPLRNYAGDMLWAIALYWFMAVVSPKWHPWKLAFITAVISYAVELSQLYHADWIDNIRAMKLGGLMLGFTFHWPDLLCYTGGAIVASTIDFHLLRKDQQSPWQW